MAIPTYPGVYVEEVSSGVRPITAASTSTPAFIGEAEKGSLTEAVKIYNFTQFQNLYGGFLANSYLAHGVYQFFNNGGAQCYIVRVAGANVRTASVGLSDRAATPQLSLPINAVSPGFWGNSVEVVVSDGTRDLGNEFNLTVFYEGETTPRESYDNLSMVPGVPNFVETATSTSKFIRVTVNQGNTNATAGTSRGAGAPTVPLPADRRCLRIDIHNDGYQEIDLQAAVGSGTGQVANLDTALNVRAAIQFVVRGLTPQRHSTPATAFSNFTCILTTGVLLLTAGVKGVASSVSVAPAANST